MCSIKSMEWYIVCGLGLIEACGCLSMFIIIFCKYLLYCSGRLPIQVSSLLHFHQVHSLLTCYTLLTAVQYILIAISDVLCICCLVL